MEKITFDWKEEEKKEKKYKILKKVGRGAFGIVYQAQDKSTKEIVAIKRMRFTTRRKDDEIKILKLLKHPNITNLREYYYSRDEDLGDLNINMVLDFLPVLIEKLIIKQKTEKLEIPSVCLKLYCYQMCRALGYLHSLGICHRDIKPGNILIDPESHLLKLCDFGSAFILITGTEDTSNMCSRFYRAPELLAKAKKYSVMIDIWAMGCVIAEFFIHRPLFPGEIAGSILMEICKILGPPKKSDIHEMMADSCDFSYYTSKPITLKKLLNGKAPPEAIDLLERLLQFNPFKRPKPFEILLHPFFDELRKPETRLPNGQPLPELFNFSEDELKSVPPENVKLLIPTYEKTVIAP